MPVWMMASCVWMLSLGACTKTNPVTTDTSNDQIALTSSVTYSGNVPEPQGLSYFEQLISLLEVFELLATSTERTALNDQDTSIKLFLDDKIRMGAVYKYIHANYDKEPDVNVVAANVHLSTPAFCRYFKKETKMTFTDFVNQYRITQAKTLLLKDMSVSEACYEVGFDSLSYFTKLFKKLTGDNPSAFKRNRYLRM